MSDHQPLLVDDRIKDINYEEERTEEKTTETDLKVRVRELEWRMSSKSSIFVSFVCRLLIFAMIIGLGLLFFLLWLYYYQHDHEFDNQVLQIKTNLETVKLLQEQLEFVNSFYDTFRVHTELPEDLVIEMTKSQTELQEHYTKLISQYETQLHEIKFHRNQ